MILKELIVVQTILIILSLQVQANAIPERRSNTVTDSEQASSQQTPNVEKDLGGNSENAVKPLGPQAVFCNDNYNSAYRQKDTEEMWWMVSDPGADALDDLMAKSTGCKFLGLPLAVYPKDIRQVYYGLFNGSLDQWFGVRARGAVDIRLYRNDVLISTISPNNHYNNGVRIQPSTSGHREFRTPDSTGGRFYVPLHIKVEPESVMVSLGCDSQKQLVTSQSTAQGDKFRITISNDSLFPSKLLYDCTANSM